MKPFERIHCFPKVNCLLDLYIFNTKMYSIRNRENYKHTIKLINNGNIYQKYI